MPQSEGKTKQEPKKHLNYVNPRQPSTVICLPPKKIHGQVYMTLWEQIRGKWRRIYSSLSKIPSSLSHWVKTELGCCSREEPWLTLRWDGTDLKPKIWWLDNMPGMLHWFFSRTRKSITLFAGRLTFMPPYHVGIPKQLVFVQLIKQNRLGRGCVPVSFLTAQSRVGRILPFSRCLIPSPDCLLVPVNISKVAILSELREIYTSWRPVIFLIITLWYTLITHY